MTRLAEALPDVLLGLGAAVVGFWLLPGADGLFAAALAIVVAVIAAVDRRVFLIPDTANLALAAGGLLLAAHDGADDRLVALADAVARGLLAGGLFWGLGAAYRARRGMAGLGFGDVKLAAAGAPWLAWTSLVPVLELAVIAALVAVSIEKWRRREAPRLDDMLPFGVFLAPALWLGFVAERTGVVDRLWPF